jgi:solute carrier family 35 (UDP-xylose/UDP-N-acetylglucosamine transporter), member B4
VIAYEQLLLYDSRIGALSLSPLTTPGAQLVVQGSALTFCQMFFVTLQTIPSFLSWKKGSMWPTLKTRQVPIKKWMIHVAVLTAGSLLNNWAYAYKVPLPVLIVFRSAGKNLLSTLIWQVEV